MIQLFCTDQYLLTLDLIGYNNNVQWLSLGNGRPL